MSPDDDPARRAWQALSELVLSADRKADVSKELGLSWARVQALRKLAGQAPVRQRALADELLADPPYVTLLLDGLEQRGLVERLPHPEDRRAKLVRLTPAGRAAAERAEAILDEPPPALRALAPDDVRDLLRILDELAG